MKIAAIVPAAGSGRRLGYSVDKPYIRLHGKPLLIYSLEVLQRSKKITQIVVVAEKKQLRRVEKLVLRYRIAKVASLVAGGRTRSESVRNGLRVLKSDIDFVLIHDGARPFLTTKLIDNCFKAAAVHKAAICAVPCASTIKSVTRDLRVHSTLNRNTLWQVQTPQVFAYRLIARAYKKFAGGRYAFFDDSSLVERLPHKVKVVPGATGNIKITTPEDLKLAKAILKTQRSTE